MKTALRLTPLGAILLAFAISPAQPQTTDARPIAIVGAKVFDGTGALARDATVVIQDGRITAVGPDVAVPPGATVIEARGKALLPGFFDLHTHWTPGGTPATLPQIATAYVKSGVTTVNDFHEQPESYAPRRAWLSELVAPHVNFAARISTPGGHGADWGDQATTIWINTPAAAQAAIESLKPYKPDLIKAFTDGWRYGSSADNSSMDEWTLRALVTAAHAAGWEVLTHTVTVDRGAVAARAGVDSLAHGLQDRSVDSDTLKQVVASGMAMIPTLAVYEPDKPGSSAKPDDPRYRQSVRKFGYALGNVKTIYDAGVRIGVGTDAGMPGTVHGRSTLHEMELLVRAGLTPAQALVAGTSSSAKIMKLDRDRGTIAPGQRADLVLIDGRPWDHIEDVYKISRVLIDGKLVYGDGAPALPAGNNATHLPSIPVDPLVDDFERADGRTALDTLRLENPDGGMDRSIEITQVVPRGADGHALQLTARMAVKDDAYAGVIFPLARGSVRPGNLSGYRGVRFDLNGTGNYSVRVNGIDQSWSAKVDGKRGWTTVSVPFSSMQPSGRRRGASEPVWNGGAVMQIEIGASRTAGQRLSMQVDNVRFY